jgi:WD40 repeat protein
MTRQDTRFIVWLEQMDQLRVRWATAPRDLKPALLLAGAELGEAEMFLHARKQDLSPEQRDYIVKSIMNGVQGRMRDREARDRVTRDSFHWWMRFAFTVSIVVTLFGVEIGAINFWHRYWVEPEISKLMSERARTRTAQAQQTAPSTTEAATRTKPGKPVKSFQTSRSEPDEENPKELKTESATRVPASPPSSKSAEPAARLIDLARDRLRHGENDVAVALALESILGTSARMPDEAPPRIPAAALSILLQAQAEKHAVFAKPADEPELASLHAAPQSLALFSADGRRILIASNDKGARLFDVEAAKEITATARPKAKTSLTVLSPDGSRLATANDEDTASLWDAAGGKLIAIFTAHEGPVVAAAFSPDGKLVLTGSQDATARLWDAHSGKLLATLRGHDASVLAVAFSADGTRLATASEDKTVRIWDASGDEIATLKGHQGPVVAVAFLIGREKVLTTSYDGTVRLWHTRKPLESRLLEGQTAPLLGAIASRDGTRVLLIGASDVPEIRDTATGTLVARLTRAPVSIRSASFTADDNTVLTLSWEGLLQVWDVSKGELVATLNKGEERYESAAFTRLDRHIMAFGSGHKLAVFSAPTDARRLVEEARRRLARCLTNDERGRLNLDGPPPAWCLAESQISTPKPVE